jgi:hypothetical protein
MMKHQRGDAGASMLVIMAVMMLGFWIFSSHDGGHGGGGHHHMTGEHGGAHVEQSTPEKTGSDKTQSLGVPPAVIDYQERAPGATS